MKHDSTPMTCTSSTELHTRVDDGGMKRRGHSFARMSNASKEESSVTPLGEQVVEDETFRPWKWRVDCVAAS